LNAVYGPQLICADCHDPHGGGGSLLLDDQDLANTKICNTCHSDEGAFDSVEMAKANWHTGVYSGKEIVRNYQRHYRLFNSEGG
jgi:predicted CXXCH cytochrome family protein